MVSSTRRIDQDSCPTDIIRGDSVANWIVGCSAQVPHVRQGRQPLPENHLASTKQSLRTPELGLHSTEIFLKLDGALETSNAAVWSGRANSTVNGTHLQTSTEMNLQLRQEQDRAVCTEQCCLLLLVFRTVLHYIVPRTCSILKSRSLFFGSTVPNALFCWNGPIIAP